MRLIDADELIEYIQGSDELLDSQKDECIECINACDTSDDVCEWRAIGANDNWSTSCDKRSIHNVFGVAWFKRCPYCGRKIRVV